MACPKLALALGLALFTVCLLALPLDARARPGEREPMVGELQDRSTSDPQVVKAAQAAVANYNMGSNSLYYFRDTHILKAQSQVRLGWQDLWGDARGRGRGVRRSAGRQIKGEPQESSG